MMKIVEFQLMPSVPRYRHQLNHTPKQIYSCDFPECDRTFVRQDLCNRHKERHTAKGSQLQRKDAILSNVSPIINSTKNMTVHGSMSPEVGRPGSGIMNPRNSQMQYPSPPANMPSPFSPGGTHTTPTYPHPGPLSATADPSNGYQQASPYRRSNSDHSMHSAQGINTSSTQPKASGPQRHGSFGAADGKTPESLYVRPPQQSAGPSYGMMSPNRQQQSYVNNQGSNGIPVSMQSPYVTPQNFTPFSLPPPGFSPVAATTAASRDMEASYAISPPQTSMSSDYQNRDVSQGQQSGPDMMLLDQMTATSTMPVFGGEGYNRSPFAIPDDFVAYLFSGQQWDTSSPMSTSQLGTQGYAK
jgi:hypothetical protein